VSCPWKNPATAAQQVNDIVRLREQASPAVKDRVLGVVQTVWSGANSFLDGYDRFVAADSPNTAEKSEAACFVRTFTEMRTATDR
jgi:hypothetical protein